MILEVAAEAKQVIDWELLEDYLELFELGSKMAQLKAWYGTTD